jgi:hypothetical protein
MSAIQVRAPKGSWSKEVQGIDKLYFIKQAIITAYRNAYEEFEGDYSEAEDATLGISIDGRDIKVSDVTDKREGMQWAIDFSSIEDILRNAKLVEVGDNIIRQMAKEDECLSAFYKKLIEYANILPSEEIDYFDGYRLMLKFSDEKYTYRLESAEKGNLYFDGVDLCRISK